MHINAYLFFDGRCEEALAFYQQALGAEMEAMMRFADAPENHMPVPKDKIMHASLKIGETRILVSDGMCTGAAQPKFEGVSLAMTAPSIDEAERLFAALSDGGTVRQPMSETFFAPRFGVVADRFGVSWMVLTEQ